MTNLQLFYITQIKNISYNLTFFDNLYVYWEEKLWTFSRSGSELSLGTIWIHIFLEVRIRIRSIPSQIHNPTLNTVTPFVFLQFLFIWYKEENLEMINSLA